MAARQHPLQPCLIFQKLDYLICDYLDDSIHSKDPINAEILDMITPLPDNYKRLIRDNIRQLLEKIPPEMGEK